MHVVAMALTMAWPWGKRQPPPAGPPPVALDRQWLGMAAFTRGDDCLAGNEPYAFHSHAVLHGNHLTLLAFTAIAMAVNVWILHHHWTSPAHPKFTLVPSRLFSVRLHILSGTIEIISGVLCWFVVDPSWLVQLMAVASLFHCLSAGFMAPTTAGIKVITLPGYYYCILLKALTAYNVFNNSDCWERTLALVGMHTIYAWFRTCWIVFQQLRIMHAHSYTLALLGSCGVVYPMIEPRLWLGLVVFVSIFRAFFVSFASKATIVTFHRENPRNFNLDIIACPFAAFAAAGAVSPHAESIKKTYQNVESKHFTEDEDVQAKTVFDAIDVDGSGELTYMELVWTMQMSGVPQYDTYGIMRRLDSNQSGGVDFDEFKSQMRPFWRWAWEDLCIDVNARKVAREEEAVSAEAMQKAEQRFEATLEAKKKAV